MILPMVPEQGSRAGFQSRALDVAGSRYADFYRVDSWSRNLYGFVIKPVTKSVKDTVYVIKAQVLENP